MAEKPTKATVADLISDPLLLRLFEYWRGKRAGRRMPARADIDPVQIPWALSRLFLVDYTPDDGFRYRLAGNELANLFGRGNLKGLTLMDFLPPERARFVEARWVPLVRDRCVVCMSGLVYLAAERTPIGERLMLPLADAADGPVTGFVGMTVCQWLSGDAARGAKHSPVDYIPVSEIP